MITSQTLLRSLPNGDCMNNDVCWAKSQIRLHIPTVWSVFTSSFRSASHTKYSITSMVRTRMTYLPWMIRIRFCLSLQNSSNSSRKQIFRDFFLFYHEIVCCVYPLESPHLGDSNEFTQHTIFIETILTSTLNIQSLYRKSKRFP